MTTVQPVHIRTDEFDRMTSAGLEDEAGDSRCD